MNADDDSKLLPHGLPSGGPFLKIPTYLAPSGINPTRKVSQVYQAGTQDVAQNPLAIDLTRLVTLHHAELYRYAFRLCGSAVDAEDLVQQTFLTAQRKSDQIRDPSCARSWLYRVLRNSFLKTVRQQRPTDAATLQLDVDLIPQDADETEIDSERIQQALDALPDEFRVVVLMYYFQQISYREIAEELDLPVGTVMSRLSRAKGRLRQWLIAADPMIDPMFELSKTSLPKPLPKPKSRDERGVTR